MTSSSQPLQLSILSTFEHGEKRSSSEYSSMAAGWDIEMADTARNLEPFESMICEFLTNEIRALLQDPAGDSEAAYRQTAYRAETLEAAIRHAAITIRFNAKWFAPVALADLLLVSLEAAYGSSSSAVLYAALLLVDTVGTYTLLPYQSCLSPTALFIAKTHYSASRMNRTKKLAENAWSVTSHILQSHLGHLFLHELLDILNNDEHRHTKDRFAEVTGALMLLRRCLQDPEGDLPSVNITVLLLRIRAITSKDDEIIREHIVDVLSEVLSHESFVSDVRNGASWDTVLAIADRCFTYSPPTETAMALMDLIVRRAALVEPQHISALARLCVLSGRPFTPLLSQGVLADFTSLSPDSQWKESFGVILRMLSSNAIYYAELTTLINRSVDIFIQTGSDTLLIVLVKKFQNLILESETVARLRTLFTRALIRLFVHCAQCQSANRELHIVFDSLCDVSVQHVDAANFLFRIRADVTGATYIDTILPQTVSSSTDRLFYVLSALPMLTWTDTILKVFRNKTATWDAYNVFLNSTNTLLGNQPMLSSNTGFVQDLGTIICHDLKHSSYLEPPIATGLNRAYVVARLIQILTAILGFHRRLTKQHLVALISVFNNNAGSGDFMVSKHCIHALTICCYETPEIMSSYMDDVIDKMSKMVTQRSLAIHVLQFLAGLSRLPDLFRNFAQHDFKKIFGVCQSYLQSTRGLHTTVERQQTPSSGRSFATSSEEALPEYVYALAHHVIVFWYIPLRRQDREPIKEYITNFLTFNDVNGKRMVEDQGIVVIDFLDRVDTEHNLADQHGLTAQDGRLVELHRVAGVLLVNNRTSLRTGRSLITVRRPTGTTICSATSGTTSLTSDADNTSYVPILPGDTHGLTYGAMIVPGSSSVLGSSEVITLTDDDAVQRGIAAIDRIPALDSHKAGVIYIGFDQTHADDILQNIAGSPDYVEFVQDLGTLQRLRGAPFNTQGLDRVDDADGSHTVVWNNDVTEMVFHVITMMPNDTDVDLTITRKKSHIGNDHVNIVFNNSSARHTFETLYSIFPSEFSYCYIVISPSARTSFVEARTESTWIETRDRFYKVQILTKPDYPNVSPAADEKLVSGASLPAFVRNLAFNDCIVSLTKSPGSGVGDYPSSWRYRLQQIRQMRSRYEGKK